MGRPKGSKNKAKKAKPLPIKKVGQDHTEVVDIEDQGQDSLDIPEPPKFRQDTAGDLI